MMADVKANMMLTASSLIVTFSIRYLMEPFLVIPTLVLITFCVITILLAIYTTMPKFPPRGQPEKKPDTLSPTFNLLFFGSFADLDGEEY